MARKNLRRAVLALSLAAVLGAGSLPAQAATDDYGWSGTRGDGPTLSFELWEDFRSQATHINRILDYQTPSRNGLQEQRICNSMTVGPCATALNRTKDGFEGTFVAPVCQRSDDENCIEWISVHGDNEPASKATLIRSIEGGTTPRLAKYGLPKGGTTSLWSQTGITNAGGTDTYAATLRMEVNYLGPQANRPYANFSIGAYNLQIKPYQEIQGDYTPHSCSEYQRQGITIVGCGGLPEECAWSGAGVCGKEVGFPSNVRVSASFRIDSTTSGWFAGRVQDPNISIQRLSAKQLRVQISGQPAEVPVARGHIATADASASLKNQYSSCPQFQTSRSCWTGIFAASTQSMAYIDGFRGAFSDTATFQRQVWSVRTVQSGSLGQCAAGESRVIGIVSTNAMGYQAEPPRFSRGFLNYQVSGMHYLPGGQELALGNYDLVVRSDFARCLYGFGRSPLSANVSVVNTKGNKVFATTTVGEKNGWLKLSAKGFTFSKKTIRVKITKAKK
jgi:hypothetical protein